MNDQGFARFMRYWLGPPCPGMAKLETTQPCSASWFTSDRLLAILYSYFVPRGVVKHPARSTAPAAITGRGAFMVRVKHLDLDFVSKDSGREPLHCRSRGS